MSVDIKDSDKTCPACYTDLDVPSFIKPEGVSKDSECGSAFRLKCGHAFHLECMCRSLRANPGCPLCRDEGQPASRAFEFTIDENGNIIDGTAELVSEIQNAMGQDEIERCIEISSKLDVVGKLKRIQTLRKNVNIAKKEYRRHEEFLKKRRSEMLDQVFEKFREDHKEKYEQSRRTFNKHLRKLKRIEAIELQKIMSDAPTDLGPHNIDKYVSYKLTDILSDAFGPQKRNFWRI